MITLRQKQVVIVRLVAKLIVWATTEGYDLKFGEAWRSPEEAARLAKLGLGIKTSLHTDRLAIDLLAFRDGVWLTRSEDYEPLGVYWESLSTSAYTCCWGGRFTRADGNHFSIAHAGRK